MSIARALAVLGAGSTGYMAGQEDSRQRKRQDEDDAFRRETRDRQRKDWTRSDQEYADAQAEKEGIRKAAAPVEGAPVYPTGDDEGNAMPAFEQKFTVPGQQAPVDAAGVASLNTPAARMGRAAGAVRDPMKAAQLMNTAQQSELGGIQLDEAKAQALAKAWDRKLGDAILGTPEKPGDPSSIIKFFDESAADGMGGKSKWAHKVEGKMLTVYPIGPDGSALNNGVTFPNDFRGRMQMAQFFSKGTSITQKIQDMRADEKAKTDRDDKDTDNKRADRQLDATIKYQDGLLRNKDEANALRLEIASMRRAAGAAPPSMNTPEATFDSKTATAVAVKDVERLADIAAGSGKPMSPQQQQALVREHVNKAFSGHSAQWMESRIAGTLRRASKDPQAYASAYADALELSGGNGEALAKLGFAPPSATGGKPTQGDARKGESRMPAPAKPARGGMQEVAGPPGPLDEAKAAKAEAYRRLQSYGSRQRNADPQGFAAAQAAMAQAEARERELMSQPVAGATQLPSFRYPAP